MSNKKTFKQRLNEEPLFIYAIYRTFSGPIANKLKDTRVTPNHVTYLSIIPGLLASLLFSFGSYWYSIAGIVLLQIAVLMDFIDGDLARLKKATSNFGWWLDDVKDKLLDFILYLALIIGFYNQTGLIEVWVLGFIAMGGHFLNETVRSTTHKLHLPSISKQGVFKDVRKTVIGQYFSYNCQHVYLILSVLLIFNQFYYFFLILPLYSLSFYVVSLVYFAKLVKKG